MEKYSTILFASLSRQAFLGVTTALISVLGVSQAHAQNCALDNGTLVDDCKHTNQGTVVDLPLQSNVELEDIPTLSTEGFEISVDGDPISEDGAIQKGKPGIEATKRRQDLSLAAADISVKFDGLDTRPRLDVETVGEKTEYKAGDSVTFQNRMNYPAFTRKGEIRILDKAVRGKPKTIAVLPLNPNGTVTTTVPQGDGLVYVYRVYDARGRFDETAPASLGSKSRRGLIDDVEEGTDSAVIRRIPVYGGAVTVSGTNVRSGSTVNTLGETVRPDADGDFVLQRILPTGDHIVSVDVAGGPSLERDIEIPGHDIFYTGLVDVTLRHSLKDQLEDATGEPYDKTVARGRVAFYLKGKIKGEYLLTAAADTGQEDLKNLLRNFDEKNPRSLLDRIDPEDYYPVYGDDSTSEVDAPTAGKLYVKLEKDDSHILWGNFKSEIKETEYLRNERTLYGAQAIYRTPKQTSRGHARTEIQLYAANPDTIPQRDVFRGTGGSTYFLKFQDITRGSETLLIEIRNPTTGQIIERKTLVYGVDYDINYVQGLVILRAPLSGSGASNDLISSNPNGDNDAFLIANYDHTPTASNLDTFSYGARVQTWVTDKLRFGATLQNENLGTSDQKAYGADLLYQFTERTFVELEYAKTDGDSVNLDESLDGGLTLLNNTNVGTSGRAYRFNAQADLQDLGANIKGVIGGYYEDRSAGFSTLSYRSSNDEELWGIDVELEPTKNTRLRFYYDNFEDSAGRHLREGGIEAGFRTSENLTWDVGLEHIDESSPTDPTRTGKRTDAAVRLTYDPNDEYKIYGFGQGTISRSGGLEGNSRVGIGGEAKINENWRISGEISGGTTGLGARAYVNYDRDENNSYYFGYTRDPNREFGGVNLDGRDKGSFVIGARRKINDSLTVYGENTYDLFGVHKSLTSTYGADYEYDDFWTFTGGIETGRVTDPRAAVASNFRRRAISLGSTYKDEDLSVRTRIEYRKDAGNISGVNRSTDTIAAEITARYKINEEARLLFNIEGVKSDNATASIPDAEYLEGTIGYALRPIDNDRLNILAKYTYLFDMTERNIGSTAASGSFLNSPRQRAHVLSFDASYDINNHWTIGGKIGGRWSEQDNGTGFVSNNATLGVINARYHVVHNWDALIEARQLTAQDLGSDTGLLAALYRHVGNNFKVGLGYNFGQFSDDLTDVTYNDEGVFLNIVGKF